MRPTRTLYLRLASPPHSSVEPPGLGLLGPAHQRWHVVAGSQLFELLHCLLSHTSLSGRSSSNAAHRWRSALFENQQSWHIHTQSQQPQNRQIIVGDSADPPCLWVVDICPRWLSDVLPQPRRAQCLFQSILHHISALPLILFFHSRGPE